MSTPDTFQNYYRDNWPPVLRFIQRRIPDPNAARDICQECFLAAWQEFGPSPPPPTWLYRTAWNQLRVSYRRSRRDIALAERLAFEHRSSSVNHMAEAVAPALNELDAQHREVLELKYWDNFSAAQIGAVLGLSEDAVWQRLSRARAAMRPLLTHHTNSDEEPPTSN